MFIRFIVVNHYYVFSYSRIANGLCNIRKIEKLKNYRGGNNSSTGLPTTMSTTTIVSPRSALLIALHIVELIPLNTDENKKFNYELMKLVIEDFAYKSPEILTHSTSWKRLESILKRHIQRCDEIWKVDIVDLYNGKLEIKSAIPNDSW